MQNAVEAKPMKNAALSRSAISIKPYVSGQPNLGLEKYDLALFDGAKQRDSIFCESNGRIKTYLTGLNELHPSVQNIKDEDEKRAKIKEIREVVARLENEFNANFAVNPEGCMEGYGTKDDRFWANVTMFKSVVPDTFDNQNNRIPTYWDSIVLELDNWGKNLDMKNLSDVVIKYAIEAGGFSLVAGSLEAARDNNQFKFYLDKIEETSALKTENKKLRNKAGAKLETLYNKDANKLFYVTKMVSLDSLFYRTGKNATPNDILYEDCDRYINGQTADKNKTFCAEKFLEYAEMSMEELKLRCIVKDATQLRLISHKPDGNLYYIKTGVLLGKTVADVVNFIKNPLNEDVYKDIFSLVDKEWKG